LDHGGVVAVEDGVTTAIVQRGSNRERREAGERGRQLKVAW